VIPSINCLTKEGWAGYALLMEKAGADALELNTSCPHGSITFRGGNVEEIIVNTVKIVREAVKIPVIAKISPMLTSPESLVLKLEEIGVDGVTIFNRFTGLEIDVKTETPVMHRGYAGHGGPWSIHYPLRWITQIRPKVKIALAGSGGVTGGEDIVRYLLSGCNAVQVCAAVYMHGYKIITEFNRELAAWMKAKNYQRLDDFRGKVCSRIKGSHEVDRKKTKIARIDNPPSAPCRAACPVYVPTQAYVRLAAKKDFAAAWRLIQAAGPFQSICGLVCHHPCEAECTRALIDEPVAIRNIKRFILEWGRKYGLKREIPAGTGQKKERVAVVGAGPAGLTAAHDLAVAGYRVTVFERLPYAGGMLRMGIPRYRLPLEVIQEEVAYIKKLGVEIRLNTTVESLAALRREFAAVCLAVGAHKERRLGISGEDAGGVEDGLSLLRRVNQGEKPALGEKVAVIGGGNTALDAARTAVRLGARTVYLVYRRTREEMPAGEMEIKAAEEEGVKIMYLVAPKKVRVEQGKVAALECINLVLGEKDRSDRRRPEEIEETDFTLRVERIITAVGQEPELPFPEIPEGWKAGEKIPDLEGLFCAGDMVSGPATVVEAIAGGRQAAAAVDAYLSESPALQPLRIGRVVEKSDVLQRTEEFRPGKREKMPEISPGERRNNFALVETGFDEETAVREARRCLACGCGVGCDLCADICIYSAVEKQGDHYVINDKCDGCGMCAQVCPNRTIIMTEREEEQ